MNTWINFIAFQLVWFAGVGGAANGLWWPGPVALVLFAGWHLRPAIRARGDLPLMGLALVLGFITDTLMAAGGLSRYAAAVPTAPWAPLWILSLWAGFALTLNHSMRWLTARPWLVAPLAAIVGPATYLAAAKVWGAVSLLAPRVEALGTLASCWFVAMLTLSLAARRWARTADDSLACAATKAP